jgi:hypothetical protein
VAKLAERKTLTMTSADEYTKIRNKLTFIATPKIISFYYNFIVSTFKCACLLPVIELIKNCQFA